MSLPVRKKIVVVGDGSCGKTSLLTAFKNGGWTDDLERYVPTVFDNFVASIELPSSAGGSPGDTMDLLLWDTAGQDDYDRLRQLSYPDTDVVLVCYAVDSPTSFENVTDKWIPELNHFCPGVPVILVALKIDLLEDEKTIESLKSEGAEPVSVEKGRQKGYEINAVAFVECSSLLNENVNTVFTKAAEAALMNTKPKKRTCILL